jgi:hypothetical protein
MLRRPADDHRLASQFGIVELLDRRIERIHVGVDDRARHRRKRIERRNSGAP